MPIKWLTSMRTSLFWSNCRFSFRAHRDPAAFFRIGAGLLSDQAVLHFLGCSFKFITKDVLFVAGNFASVGCLNLLSDRELDSFNHLRWEPLNSCLLAFGYPKIWSVASLFSDIAVRWSWCSSVASQRLVITVALTLNSWNNRDNCDDYKLFKHYENLLIYLIL